MCKETSGRGWELKGPFFSSFFFLFFSFHFGERAGRGLLYD